MASYFYVFGFHVSGGVPIGLPPCVDSGLIGTFGKNPPSSSPSAASDSMSAQGAAVTRSKSPPLPPPKGVTVKDANVQDLHFVCSQVFPDKASAAAYLTEDPCARQVAEQCANYVLYELP